MPIRYLIIITLLIAFSCVNKEIKSEDFEIAKIDYHGDKLQRIFIVVGLEKVYDTAYIGRVICSLKNSYKLDKNSAISFFSNKKYADYKTELFMDGKNLLPQNEYKNWMDTYYLGEYEFENNQYKTFPISSLTNKQNEYKLKSCH